jgi:heptosyltransferase-2
MRGAAQAIAETPVDVAVVFPHSFRAAMLAWMTGARRRLAYDRGGRKLLLTDHVPPHREDGNITPVYMAHEYLDLLAPLGIEDDGEGLELGVDEQAYTDVRERLSGSGPLVALAPGAAFGESKRWLPERFAQVADQLTEDIGARCVLLTGPGEEGTREAVRAAAHHPLLSADDNNPTLDTLKAAIAASDLLIGNDSGPRHVAIALKKPVICIMGPTSPRYTDSPWERGRVLRIDVDCGPCQKPYCVTDHRCMTGIPAETVTSAALEFLR